MWPEQFVALMFLASFVSMATDHFNARGKRSLARHCHAAMLGLFGGVAFFLLVALVIVCADPHSSLMFSSRSSRQPNLMTGWQGKALKLSFQLAPLNGALVGATCGILLARLRGKPRLPI